MCLIDIYQIKFKFEKMHPQAPKRPSISSQHEIPLQLMKQFGKGVLKKSDLLLLQRYCEQNGINYNQLIESTFQRQKANQSVIVYDPIPQAKDTTQGFAPQNMQTVPTSLKHGKNKSVGVLNPANPLNVSSHQSLNIFVKQGSQAQSSLPTQSGEDVTQRNSSARGVKFNLESSKAPQNYIVGSNSNQSLSTFQDPMGSKFHKNVNNISVVSSVGFDKPAPGFSASNGYLTQVHSPSKRIKSGNGKSTPEMQPIHVGMKQSISSKHPQKKEASVYSNSHVNSSILSNSQHMGDTTLIQNTSLVDDHQSPFEYQFHSRPSSLEKKIQVQHNPVFQQQLRKQIEINNFLRGQLVSDSPEKTDKIMHVAQQKAMLPGVQYKGPKAQQEDVLRPYQKALSEFKRSDAVQTSGQKSTIYQNNLIGSQFGGKQTRSGAQSKYSSGGLNGAHHSSHSSTTHRSARAENFNVSQDAIKVAANDTKQAKSSLLIAQSQKKMKADSLHSHKVSQQKFVLNPAPQVSNPKQAQIQNIILSQSKRQKAKTNISSLNSSFLNPGPGGRKSDAGIAKGNHPQNELMHYIDNFQKATAGQKEAVNYDQKKQPQVRTTQSSPRTLNSNATVNRNYYKQQISAPSSDKYQMSSSNLLNGSYSELHNLPNDNKSSKRSLQVESNPKQSVSGQRKIQQQAKVNLPYAPVQRKDYFSRIPSSGPAVNQAQSHSNSQTASGSQTPSRLMENHLVYQYQDLSTIQVEHSDQVIRDKRLSLNVDRKHSGQKSPSLNDQYIALLQRNQSRLSSNEDSSTDQANRKHLNPIMDGGTGTSNTLMKDTESDSNRHLKGTTKQVSLQSQAAKQSKTPNIKKEQMVYMLQKQTKPSKKDQSPSIQVTKKNDSIVTTSSNPNIKYQLAEKAQLKQQVVQQYRLPTEQKQDKISTKPYQQSLEDQRHSLHVLFENINSGMGMDKRSNSQPAVDNVQLRLKPNIIDPTKQQKDRIQSLFEQQNPQVNRKSIKGDDKKNLIVNTKDQRQSSGQPSKILSNNIIESDTSMGVKQSQVIEEKIANSQYVASGNMYVVQHPPSGSSTAKSSGGVKSGSIFKKQNSQVSIKKQPSQTSLHHSRPSSALRKNEESNKPINRAERRESEGPRKQSRADKPLKAKEPFITSLENFAREMEEECQRLVTEEEENQIRDVASDINERAFYGKIMRTKKALEQGIKTLHQLSPRSQEIANVMQLVHDSFKSKGIPPVTQITFYRIGKMLGRGAFGKVNLAMHKLVRKLVALKSLNKQILTDETHKAKLMKEVNLLLKLRHNHVVKIYETIETEKHIIIVMELCAGGDLLNYVRKRRRLKEPYAQKIFKQLIDGLCYIHAKQIAHRDIKLDNILLDGKGNVKIGDFGVSRQITEGQVMREQCGTPAYIAPEILRNKGYSLNVDIWSAGVVLFAMLYGTVPFKAQSMEELHSLILKGKYLLKEDISEEARDMLRGLLDINPKKRLTIKQIYQHPWLKSMDKNIQLFTDEEREMIKKEYTYNDPSRYNRNENEEPVDCFTEHGFESEYSTFKNQTSKSVILAPFNSTMSDNQESINSQYQLIQSLMLDKPDVIRFAKKCREIDRQYEFNNNGKLDNGVYHKQIANNSFEGDQNMSGTQGIEIVQTLTETPSIQYPVKAAKGEKRNDKGGLSATGEAQETFETFQREASQRQLDNIKIQKLVAFGYPESYVRAQLEQMQPNYCTAGYYLLEMDQNYC